MGYIKHNAVIVTNWDYKELEAAHTKAREIYEKAFEGDQTVRDAKGVVTDIISGICNCQASFVIVPDGSKEGWADGDVSDKARTEFLDWLLKNQNFSDYIEVRFGGDDDMDTIIRSKDSDLKKLDENR